MRRRRIWQLYSRLSARWDNYSDNDPEWLAWYSQTVKCERCFWPRRSWHEHPSPIEIILPRALKHRASIAAVSAFPELIRSDLLEVLRPYLRHFVLGSCSVRTPKGLAPADYSTIYTPEPHQLEPHRGEHCRHQQCPACGRIWNNVFWAKGGVLERSLDDRLLYQDCHGWLYIDGALAEDLRLKELFPDLRYYKKYPVIKEPLDGDILPGDPGWDGTFRPRAVAPFAEGEFGTAQ